MYKRRVNVRGIIFKDGNLFCQKLKDLEGQVADYWCTPGGGMDDGEDILSALHREMIEETGVEPKIGKLMYVQQFHDGDKEQLEFFFHIKNADDYIDIDLSKASHGLEEVSECRFINVKQENVLPIMLTQRDIQKDIDQNEPVFISSHLM